MVGFDLLAWGFELETSNWTVWRLRSNSEASIHIFVVSISLQAVRFQKGFDVAFGHSIMLGILGKSKENKRL